MRTNYGEMSVRDEIYFLIASNLNLSIFQSGPF